MSQIIGYGKSPKGKVAHAIIAGGFARCDKRMGGLVVDPKAKPTDVDCSKCILIKEVKDAQPIKPDRKDIGLTTPILTAKKKAEPKKKPIKKVEEYDFVSQKSKGDTYSIYHRPSKRKFFENIPGKIIDHAVINLNDMAVRWDDAKDKIPDGFINECRKSLKLAYEEAGLEPPKGISDESKPKRKAKKKAEPKRKTRKFKKGEELELNGVMHVFNGEKWERKVGPTKPKRTIKRREKKAKVKPKRTIKRRKKAEPEKSKRKIKRREKVETNEYGMMPGRPPFAIVEYLKDNGSQFNDIVKMLMDEYKLTEKRAKNKVKRIVNKLARRLKVQIAIVMTEDERTDHYMIM